MKLRYSPASPFVRKVLVQAMETGLSSKIEQVPTVTSDPASGLVKENPLGKIPILTLDDGSALYDSPVICEYLDSLHDGARMFPAAGPKRWTALRRQALADGMMDAAVGRRVESLRPDNEKSPSGMEAQRAKVSAGLDALEAEVDKFGNDLDIGLIAIGCALGYLDLRFAAEDWRKGHPKLARWFEAFSNRPSMKATKAN